MFRIYLIVLFILACGHLGFAKVADYDSERKCGTFASPDVKSGILDIVAKKDINDRPILNRSFPSKRNLFLIHYDTTGINAVQPDDNNANGVPDYVDSVAYYFEKTYDDEVAGIGYDSPIPDSGIGGSDAYDIYLLNIGESDRFYGVTYSELEILPPLTYNRWTSYIVIDNDFSITDSVTATDIYGNKYKQRVYSTTGISALKITAAHEFFHAIQYLYGESWYIGMFAEMWSTFMEHRFYPEIGDYLQYTGNLFANPELSSFASANARDGYQYSIYGQMVYKEHGDDICKRFWELFRDGKPGARALDSALRENESDYVNEWKRFTDWVYHTGERTVAGKYFDDAAEMPELKLELKDEFFSPPSAGVAKEISPFGFSAVRFNFRAGDIDESDDTVDVIVSNIDFKSAVSYKTNPKRAYTLQCFNMKQDSSIKIEGTNYYYKLTDASGFIDDSLYIYPGNSTFSIDYAFPSPYIAGSGNVLYFPVPGKALLYDYAKLQIFNIEMNRMLEKKIQIMPFQRKKVLILDGLPDKFSSGVYIYKIIYDSEFIGKFAVIRK